MSRTNLSFHVQSLLVAQPEPQAGAKLGILGAEIETSGASWAQALGWPRLPPCLGDGSRGLNTRLWTFGWQNLYVFSTREAKVRTWMSGTLSDVLQD